VFDLRPTAGRRLSKRGATLSAAPVLRVLSCLSLVFVQAQAASPVGELQSGADFPAIDAYVLKRMGELGVPGAALAITKDDRIVHLKGLGAADSSGRAVTPQTPFWIGSLSKSFTALAVMQLAEAGKIELDAPVQRYLPWFRVADESSSAQITVRHLLNQTSGFSASTGNAFWDGSAGAETVVRSLKDARLGQPVGTRFQYSNVNYITAGLLVEAVSGEDYAAYIERHVFTPLDMRHSHTREGAALADGMAVGHYRNLGRTTESQGVRPPAYLAAGFLIASAEDLAHYAIALLNEGRYGQAAVLSASGIAELHRPALPVWKDFYYAMGWVVGPIDTLPSVWHNGDAGRSHAMVILVPGQKLGVVVLANASGFGAVREIDEIEKGVLSLLLDRAAPSSLPLFAIAYWAILLVPVAQLVPVLVVLRRWRRGDYSAQKDPPAGWARLSWWIALTVIPNLAIAALFLLGMPQIASLPIFSGFRLLYPEVAFALLAGGVLGIGWSIAYTTLILRTRRAPAP
jgi:CubicO group peptidase (beta-lactamase class C family)